MDDTKDTGKSILTQIADRLERLTKQELSEKTENIEHRLFEFANFMEAQLVFLYTSMKNVVPTENIIKKAIHIEKGIVLPFFDDRKKIVNMYKINNYDKDLFRNSSGILEPVTERCKRISLQEIDIAVIPGVAFDDKCSRIGFGNNYYTKLIPRFPETCRKLALAYEDQLVDPIQMESRKFAVDIIITDQRVIYKI